MYIIMYIFVFLVDYEFVCCSVQLIIIVGKIIAMFIEGVRLPRMPLTSETGEGGIEFSPDCLFCCVCQVKCFPTKTVCRVKTLKTVRAVDLGERGTGAEILYMKSFQTTLALPRKES